MDMKKVAVAIISEIRADGTQAYLLVKSKKDFGSFTGLYYPPGGHIETNETPEEGLIRELQEELSLDIRVCEQMAVTPGDVPDQETYWYSCEIAGGTLQIRNDELDDARYFTVPELQQLPLWPATKKFFLENIL